jgi:hypothetical protein
MTSEGAQGVAVQEFALILLANVACIFILIAVHEAGHFLAGWAGGIPVGAMWIRLLTFPQHVALRDGEEWVTPFDLARYVAIMQRHLGSGARLFLYTAGGMIVGTLFAVAAVVLATVAGYSGMAIMIAAQSLGMGLIYIFVMDLPMALRRGYPWGDVSGMWFIAKIPVVVFVFGMLAVDGLLLWYAIA